MRSALLLAAERRSVRQPVAALEEPLRRSLALSGTLLVVLFAGEFILWFGPAVYGAKVNEREKRTFLVVYDYGMGGVWILFDARSPDEIESLYPELKVVYDRPAWLDDERWRQIDRDAHFDIDDEPTGWLVALIAEREPGAGS